MSNSRLKVMVVVGTRPEIIRLAATIKLLDSQMDLVLVHTGQNYDYTLNEVFFNDLGLRAPDHYLAADTSSLGSSLGTIIQRTEAVLIEEKPDAFLVLGDTNSCISAVIAKRLKVPVFHMEAGNRSFDENVPEETNRRLVDHVADYNLVYTEHARRNLIAEGLQASRIAITGSPMREVLAQNIDAINASSIVTDLGLATQQYFLVSLHREENVDNPARLRMAVDMLASLHAEFGLPVLVSTHPRTKKRLDELGSENVDGVTFHEPFGFHDYNKLQVDAKLVLSDSGTISEESSILGFPAVTLRDFIERPEAQDTGSIVTCGLEASRVMQAVHFVLASPVAAHVPDLYCVEDTSRRVAAMIMSNALSHERRLGLFTRAK